jgi:hypothetical protein
MRKTSPFALSWPSSVEGSEPMTLLRIAEAAEGWRKVVIWPVPIEKLSQSMIARFDPWVITVDAPVGLPIVAVPAVTVPPVGFADTSTGNPTPVAKNAITREDSPPSRIGPLRALELKVAKELKTPASFWDRGLVD